MLLRALIAGALLSACGARSGLSVGEDGGPGPEPTIELSAPRPLAPISTARVGTDRPALRWELPDGAAGARIELCADRACTRLHDRLDATGSEARAPRVDAPVVFWRLRALDAEGRVGREPSVVWQYYPARHPGPASSLLGFELDLDGDGHGDVAASTDGSEGTFVWSGRAALEGRAHELHLPESAAGEGHRLRAVGDVNGDGYGDMLSVANAPPRGHGAAFLILGGPAIPSLSASVIATYDEGGHRVSAGDGLGDLDGDGYADIALVRSCPRLCDPVPSVIEVYLGGPDGVRSEVAMRTEIGDTGRVSLDSIGDTDGDGRLEIAISAAKLAVDDRRVRVHRPTAEGVPAEPALVIEPRYGDPYHFAFSLAGHGDLDGDGLADLVLGGGLRNGLPIDVHFGRAGQGLPATPDRILMSSGPSCGDSAHAGPDVDGDGIDDLVVGCMWVSASALVWSGLSGEGREHVRIDSPVQFLLFGSAVVLRDLDADGHPELLVGAETAGGRGQLYVYRGVPGGFTRSPVVIPAPPEVREPGRFTRELGR